MFGASLGVLLVTVLALPLVNSLGDGQRAWILAFVIFGAVAAVLFLTTFFNTKERIVDVTRNVKRPGLGETLKLAMRNRYWLILFLLHRVQLRRVPLHRCLDLLCPLFPR